MNDNGELLDLVTKMTIKAIVDSPCFPPSVKEKMTKIIEELGPTRAK